MVNDSQYCTPQNIKDTCAFVYEALKDTRELPGIRITAIAKLQMLITEQAQAHEVFMSSLDSLKEVIALQFKDLNAMVIRDTCDVINKLAETLGDAFADLGEFLVPKLLPLLFVRYFSNLSSIYLPLSGFNEKDAQYKQISMSANGCIGIIVKNCLLTTGIRYLMDLLMNSKEELLRTKSGGYLQLVLDT
jgi:hypothetical protein